MRAIIAWEIDLRQGSHDNEALGGQAYIVSLSNRVEHSERLSEASIAYLTQGGWDEMSVARKRYIGTK